MNRTSPVRRQSRFPVCWPVLYGNDEFLAEGTVLDLTQIGWRVAGSMPVSPGMQLTLQLWVPGKPEPVRLERASVLWVKDCEFAIEAHEMSLTDQAWVTEFLNQKLGASWMSRAADDRPSFRIMGEEPRDKASVQHMQRPSVEAVMRLFIAAQTDLMYLDAEAMQRDHAQHGGQENDARAASDRLLHEVWHSAFRILNGMVARKADRELTGRDSIANN